MGLVSQLSCDGNELENIPNLVKLEDSRFLCDAEVKDNDIKT